MMKGGIAGLMKQAQQMQENMKKMQDQLASVEVEGQSGAGMVKVQMTCKYDVRRVSIDESVMICALRADMLPRKRCRKKYSRENCSTTRLW